MPYIIQKIYGSSTVSEAYDLEILDLYIYIWPWAIKCFFRTFGKKNAWAWLGLAQPGPGWVPLCLGPGRLGSAWLGLGWAWLIWKWSGLARWPGPPRPGLGSGPCSPVRTLTGLAQAWPGNFVSFVRLA